MSLDLSDWETDGPPAWARKPLAWAACLIDALPLAIASLAFFQWRVGTVSVVLGLGVYAVIVAFLALALRPWMAGAPSDRTWRSRDSRQPLQGLPDPRRSTTAE